MNTEDSVSTAIARISAAERVLSNAVALILGQPNSNYIVRHELYMCLDYVEYSCP